MEKEDGMKTTNTMRELLKQRFCLILALLLIVFTVSVAAEEKNEAETWLALARDAHEQEDYETSFRYYEQAAKAGSAEGQYMTAISYYYGMGTEQSYEKAAEYMSMAADQGDANARTMLAMLYVHGIGVEQSYEKALAYFKLSAAQNDPVAQYNLGWMYMNGDGVEPSREKALEYWRLSADQKNPDAMMALASVHLDRQNQEYDIKKGWNTCSPPRSWVIPMRKLTLAPGITMVLTWNRMTKKP